MIVRCGNVPRTAIGWRATVRVDGKIVPGVVLADEEHGIVYCVTLSPLEPANDQGFRSGGVTLDAATGDYCLTVLTGVVKIEIPPLAATAPATKLTEQTLLFITPFFIESE